MWGLFQKYFWPYFLIRFWPYLESIFGPILRLFFSLMSYYAKTNSLPEPKEIEIGEQLLLSNESFHYLKIDAMRDSMILVRSNLATFDNLWIPTCSLLIHENRRKLKENDTIGKYPNRLDLKNFLTTRKFFYFIEQT